MTQPTLPAPAETHVWHVPVLHQQRSLDQLFLQLPEDEQERARQYRLTDARARHVTARAALRSIIGGYTRCAPRRVQLHTEPGGKPMMTADADLHFSISHVHGTALIAVGRTPLGVDLERVREPYRLERTAARLFHQETIALLARHPPEQRLQLFFDAWTQREAHVKAVGGGLFRTRDTLPFEPGMQPDEIRVTIDRSTGEPWWVARLSCAGGMRAALVASDRIERIIHKQWEWSE